MHVYRFYSCLRRYPRVDRFVVVRITAKPTALRQAQKDLGDISRDELSRRMGVSTMTAYRVDSGQTEPSPKFIAALMTVTGRPFEDLFEVHGSLRGDAA